MKQGGTVITTVSEGKVAFSEYSKTVELTANESGLAYADGRLVEEKVDIKPLLAWKENKFIFENASIREVMHSLEQWYDVSVEYKQEPDDHFNLEISRSEPVQKVLALMEQTGRVKFRLKDNKIVVQR
ncbi:MAG: DUF4974 domain-containing protein [Chitinophagaceae bacterium]|nr:MAG: DUF4974 domain-containing protein [Chitinophagaceae bacterium]